MPSPFPGMNPYLEHPKLWAGIHLLLIAALTESLAPQLRPKYRVAVEVRMYQTSGETSLLVVKQGYLEIREVATSEVVTAIELLSPVNKRSGEGPMLMKVSGCGWRGSSTHLVEIDLLRSWKPMPILNNGIESHYRILVRRGDRRPSADLYAFNLQQEIPLFPLPLKLGDAEPLVDIHQLLDTVYDRGGVRFRDRLRSTIRSTFVRDGCSLG